MSSARAHGRAKGTAAAAAAFVALAGASGAAAAADLPGSPHGGGAINLYVDSQRTTVWSPSADAGATLPGEIDVTADWVMDVITSASVDVVTAATPRMEEIRHQLSGGLSRELGMLALDGGYTLSLERDYEAHSGRLGARLRLLGDALELGAIGSFAAARVGIAREPREGWRSLRLGTFDLGATITADKRTFVELVYSFVWSTGYQANPYRRVPVTSSGDLREALWVEEIVPADRFRHAFTARVRRSLGDDWIAWAEERLYVDSWSLLSSTTGLGAVTDLTRWAALEMRGRASFQTGAAFYRERYEELTAWRTRDRRLSPHFSAAASAALLLDVGPIGPIESVDLRIGIDAIAWRYGKYLEPVLAFAGDPTLEPMGWEFGGVAMIALEVTP